MSDLHREVGASGPPKTPPKNGGRAAQKVQRLFNVYKSAEPMLTLLSREASSCE